MHKNLSLLVIITAFATTGISQDADSYFKIAERKYNSKDYEKAVEYYTKAIEIDHDYLNAYLRRAFIFGILGKYEQAVADYTKVISLQPDKKWAYISRGSARNKLGQYKMAIKDFNRALKHDPKNQEALNNRGWAKKGQGNMKGACADWKKSKKLGNQEAKIVLKNNHCK